MQHVRNVLAAHREPGKCRCSSAVSVPGMAREQENLFCYDADKHLVSQAAPLHPSAFPGDPAAGEVTSLLCPPMEQVA